MMNVNFTAHQCVWLRQPALQCACNQTCTGRFHSTINEGVCGPKGRGADACDWPKWRLGFRARLQCCCWRVTCLCVFIYWLFPPPPLQPSCYSHSIASYLLLTGMYGKGGMCWGRRGDSGEEESREKGMRCELESVVVVLWNGVWNTCDYWKVGAWKVRRCSFIQTQLLGFGFLFWVADPDDSNWLHTPPVFMRIFDLCINTGWVETQYFRFREVEKSAYWNGIKCNGNRFSEWRVRFRGHVT